MPLILLDDPDSTLSMLRDSVAGLAARADGPATMRRRRAEGADLDAGVWSAMAEAGFLGLTLPEDLGGMGLGSAELVVLAEALGRALLTEAYTPLAVFPGALLAGLTRSAAILPMAEGLIAGAQILPVLWQDARGCRAPLSLTADATLTGEAHLVSGASAATGFLVLAQDADGLALVHLDAGAEGLRLHQRPGVDGATLARVTLHAVPVTASQVLGRGEAVEAALTAAIEISRLALAAELAGLASRALEITVEYTSNRVQFGKTIASFQAIQHRLVDMWAEAEFACAAVAHAATTTAEDRAQAVLAAKARAGDAATAITRKAIQLHGAMGFTDQCDIGLYLKRAISLNATLGQPEALRLAFLDADLAA
ncbi:acyl-CoA dehydrogenase family protein [Pararhodobacter zhoushanensis]|uniref:Acyl-CoA/acyl-ACP dehydrogenase n=1 Tax=Pararhodobacter zhoushanensis TaxID=2479545 RepID=A0ABT3GTZ5_9RHOB|nr:acyl-CoA dehydrogenase family protein [Pararhodobacter zhoushanensis]MCW1931011.1 acyl-CoA/acyl-ACP dehydrogenase [Pararhodobacter zhoushanensis]